MCIGLAWIAFQASGEGPPRFRRSTESSGELTYSQRVRSAALIIPAWIRLFAPLSLAISLSYFHTLSPSQYPAAALLLSSPLRLDRVHVEEDSWPLSDHSAFVVVLCPCRELHVLVRGSDRMR